MEYERKIVRVLLVECRWFWRNVVLDCSSMALSDITNYVSMKRHTQTHTHTPIHKNLLFPRHSLRFLPCPLILSIDSFRRNRIASEIYTEQTNRKMLFVIGMNEVYRTHIRREPWQQHMVLRWMKKKITCRNAIYSYGRKLYNDNTKPWKMGYTWSARGKYWWWRWRENRTKHRLLRGQIRFSGTKQISNIIWLCFDRLTNAHWLSQNSSAIFFSRTTTIKKEMKRTVSAHYIVHRNVCVSISMLLVRILYVVETDESMRQKKHIHRKETATTTKNLIYGTQYLKIAKIIIIALVL